MDSRVCTPSISTVTRVISPADSSEESCPSFPSKSNGRAASITFLVSDSILSSTASVAVFTSGEELKRSSRNSAAVEATYFPSNTYLNFTVEGSGDSLALKAYFPSGVRPSYTVESAVFSVTVSNVVKTGAVMTSPPESMPTTPTKYLFRGFRP